MRISAFVCAVVAATSVTAIGAGTSHGAETPVTVMTMGDLAGSTEWPDAVKSRFDTINERGGIRDASGARHEVEVVV